MENQTKIRCSSCGKSINCSSHGIETRMKKFKDKEDFEKNFKCRTCKPKK